MYLPHESSGGNLNIKVQRPKGQVCVCVGGRCLIHSMDTCLSLEGPYVCRGPHTFPAFFSVPYLMSLHLQGVPKRLQHMPFSLPGTTGFPALVRHPPQFPFEDIRSPECSRYFGWCGATQPGVAWPAWGRLSRINYLPSK